MRRQHLDCLFFATAPVSAYWRRGFGGSNEPPVPCSTSVPLHAGERFCLQRQARWDQASRSRSFRIAMSYRHMPSLEGIALNPPNKHHALPLPYLTSAGPGLGSKAGNDKVRYCKNCLLVYLHCLFPPIFACASRHFG